MQEDVKEPAIEETVATDQSPVEEETTNDVPQEPADATIEPEEKEVSKTVPYERFKEVNDRLKSLEDRAYQVMQPQEQYEVPELDEGSARAVDARAKQIYEAQETAKFNAKHGQEFQKDPLLQASYMVEANKAMAKGGYIDREAVLEQAKASLDARVKPATAQAKQEGIKEGQDIAKTKQQLGAVGETGAQKEIDPDNLSAEEFAKFHGLK